MLKITKNCLKWFLKGISVKFYLSLIFISFLALVTNAQVVTVKDIESNENLELVTLVSENFEISKVTNSSGNAKLDLFKNTEKIHFQLLGYQSVIKSYKEIEENNFLVYLTRKDITLDQVIISAVKWSQYSSDIPSKIISVTPKEIILQNPQTAADLLNISGKVFVQKSQQGGGSPMIRGFSTNRLLYTIDGIRMNTAIFRSGNIQNVISLDPFTIENSEVFFGPGSVIYGSDAIGGVMSFKTLTPQISLSSSTYIKGSANTRYSTANNEKTVHFDINVGWEKWAFITSLTSNDYDDLKMGSHGPDDYLKSYYVQRQNGQDIVIANEDEKVQIPSAYSQINLMQKIRFNPNERWDLQYGFHYSETSDYGRYDRHLRLRDSLPRYAEWNYGPQKWMMNNLNITEISNNSIYDQMTLRIAVQSFEESRIDRSLNNDYRNIKIENVDAYSINIDFLKYLNHKINFYYGAEYVYNEVNSNGKSENILTGIQVEGPSRYPKSTWQSIAGYLNGQYKYSDQFVFQAGLRYNHFLLNSKFDNTFYPFPFSTADINNGEVTGSLGFVYRPEISWVISTNLSTGFRSPNVDDIGKVFDSEPGAVVVPNPSLKAEYAYNIDLSLAKIFGNSIKIDLTGYYTILNNALVKRDYLLNGQDSIFYDGILSKVQAIQNAAQASVIGVQSGLEIKLPFGFSFYSNLNYQLGEEELDDGTTSPSRHAAPWYGVTRLTFSKNNLTMQLYAAYQGEKQNKDLAFEEQGKTEIYASDINGNPYSPSWYTLNFKGMYSFTKNFTITSGIENITDQRYRTYSSGISAPGRNFVLSLKINY